MAPEEKTVSMEVLVLGLCRTGTLSMKFALEELGYQKVYHFFSIDEHQSHPDLWIAALQQKYGQPATKADGNSKIDLGQLLGGYNAVTDIPAVCFAPELIAEYPNAKIILTTRSEASWHKSMLLTIHALQSSSLNRIMLSLAAAHTRKLSHLIDLIIKYYFRGSIPLYGREVFEGHNEIVKTIALREGREFLEYRLGGGWKPLCEFLGKDVPGSGFPRVNDSASWRKAFGLEWDRSLLWFGLCATVVGIFVMMR